MVDKINGLQAQQSQQAKTSGQKYDEWSYEVASLFSEGKTSTATSFQITGSLDTDEYFDNLEYLARSYIALHDNDGDGQISYDEFIAKEIKKAKSLGYDFSEQEAKALLEPVFKNLNVSNNGNNDLKKESLSLGEMMGMFFTMDGAKELDGKISPKEYLELSEKLGKYNPNTQQSEGVLNQLKNNYSIFETMDGLN